MPFCRNEPLFLWGFPTYLQIAGTPAWLRYAVGSPMRLYAESIDIARSQRHLTTASAMPVLPVMFATNALNGSAGPLRDPEIQSNKELCDEGRYRHRWGGPHAGRRIQWGIR